MDTLKKSQIVSPTVESTRSPFTGNSQGNEMAYFIENFLNGRVNTALPCKVQAVCSDGISPTGRVDVLPLIVSLDAKNNAINPAPLYNLPYCRIQGGAAALVCDPVPGDIGLAVFCQRDVSNVVNGTPEPVQPGSFRNFDISDGFFIGGFLNQQPTCYIQILPDGNVIVTAPQHVTVNTSQTTINSNTTINGNLTVTGNTTVQQRLDVIDNATIKGISFADHVHGNVESGNSNTGTPK